jgi:hypothetical protein
VRSSYSISLAKRYGTDIRFWPPISYSHFHVPTGAVFLYARKAADPSTNAAERIVFRFCLQEFVGREPFPRAAELVIL